MMIVREKSPVSFQSADQRKDSSGGPGDRSDTRDPSWQEVLREAYTSVPRLLKRVGLTTWADGGPPSPALPLLDPPDEFGLLAPEPFVSRIRPGDPEDPLLRQILPTTEELLPCPGFCVDPLREEDHKLAGAILQKYTGRCLVLTTSRCAIHCRFCFRRFRSFCGSLDDPATQMQVLRTIEADRSLREVILSGGDPLVLGDDTLGELVERLGKIGHLRRIRIHSRVPIALPQRIDDQLVKILAASKIPVYMVVHVNHPREIDTNVETAIRRLVQSGIPVLSQSVLLRRVNDRAQVLVELFEKLLDLQVIPYYLHQLDRVQGAAHFEVDESGGLKIIKTLRQLLPGYGVPRYVREVPGERSKLILA